MATTIETQPLKKVSDTEIELSQKVIKEQEVIEKLTIADLRSKIAQLDKAIKAVTDAKTQAAAKYTAEIAEHKAKKTKLNSLITEAKALGVKDE